MKKSRFLLFAALVAALVSLAAAAAAQSARVITPGGALNMRKTASAKSGVVAEVPNRALVEVLETEGEWTKIAYKKKTGYVKTEFLKLPAQMVGKTVYTDGGTALLRKEAAQDASILRPVSGLEPLSVLAVEGDWAQVQAGEAMGYMPVEALSYQREAPEGALEWISEEGTAVQRCALLAAPEAAAAPLGELEAGRQVTVTVTEGDYCLVLTEEGCGYAPLACISLRGAQDSGERAGNLTPLEAAERATAALKKQFKAFGKEKLYSNICVYAGAAQAPLYHCGFFNDQDQYLYGALIDAHTGEAVFGAAYKGFALPVAEVSLLPAGEVALALSADTLAVGAVLDIEVRAWTAYQCQYTLYQGEKQLAASEPGGHFSAAFRPREAGEYRLAVAVTDEEGRRETAEQTFTVDGSLPAPSEMALVYSQKDGWWLDKLYRHNSLQKSGCAIFALSSALQRMGFAGEDVLPQNLARTYALCHTPEGTNNERLIREAGTAYGFGFRASLSRDQKWIADRLQSGALFTFSVARGHIALIDGLSEDGAMAHIVDSAPNATFTRIVNGEMYYQTRSGAFRAALAMEDLPGARWYIETDDYGGLEYWLPMSYVTRRGVRLIQPAE